MVQEWEIKGSYCEACNCDWICPCRVINGADGGDSTYGYCEFLASWKVDEGHAGGIDLAGASVVMAARYSDNEENKPWTVMLYVDGSAAEEQFEALSGIFLGRAGGNLEFTQAILHIAGVNRADIQLDHRAGQESIRVGNLVSAEAVRHVGHDFPVSCGIAGHDKPGEELVTNHYVHDGPFDWTYQGRAGFSSWFSYKGPGGT